MISDRSADEIRDRGDEGINALVRRVDFMPAFHKVHDDPRKNYGVHGVEIHFYLTGDAGTVQFKMHTDWMLPETHAWWKATGRDKIAYSRPDTYPMAADLGYHSRKQFHDYQLHTPAGECEFIDGDCYYDGSGLNAEPVLARLIAEGDEGVWAALEDFYADVFADELSGSTLACGQPNQDSDSSHKDENPNPIQDGADES